jgi:hypothetical protein
MEALKAEANEKLEAEGLNLRTLSPGGVGLTPLGLKGLCLPRSSICSFGEDMGESCRKELRRSVTSFSRSLNPNKNDDESVLILDAELADEEIDNDGDVAPPSSSDKSPTLNSCSLG